MSDQRTPSVHLAQSPGNLTGVSYPPRADCEQDFERCPRCGSPRVWRNGYRDYPHQNIQRYLCPICGLRFSGSCGDYEQSSYTSSQGLQSRITKENAKEMTQEIADNVARATHIVSNGDITQTNNLFNYSWYLKKNGLSESTIKTYTKMLRTLFKRGADLEDPENVKGYIAEQPWDPKRKQNAVNAYNHHVKMNNRTWIKPRYKELSKPIFIPKESEIDALIAGTGLKTSVFLQCLKETGARAGEILNLQWTDIDFESNIIRITPEKHSNARTIRVSQSLLHRLGHVKTVNRVTDPNRIFGRYNSVHKMYSLQKKTLARKLGNERLTQIKFHTLRHWHATKLYHETKDIYYVQLRLGHKRIVNTMKYIHLADTYFGEEDDEYITKVAETIEQAIPLIEAGYTQAAEYNGIKIFKTPKSRLRRVR